ncbi:hypothetical protein XENOCAPTIV_007740 [Xenoophorus captivus]|uniref:PH domain-containing protein n=1 Tax=Xenoophorus captivus TaxID=1517983 RepID=A0ABV0SER0_9TELE
MPKRITACRPVILSPCPFKGFSPLCPAPGVVSSQRREEWLCCSVLVGSAHLYNEFLFCCAFKSVRYNEGHALFLSAVARKEGTKRGYLSKKTAENSRWSEKFFALYQNVLFYFENEQSARPAGIYLLEGCTCERTPAPKVSTTGKEALEKQVR